MKTLNAAALMTAWGLLMLAAGCSRTDNEPGPGGVTVSEARALDEAAEMLESRDAAATANANAPSDKAAPPPAEAAPQL